MSYTLSELFLGCADGESESIDPDFINFFYKGNKKYEEIMNNPIKYIISGQKGTGKTFLAKYIEKICINENFATCKLLNKQDIMLNMLIEINKTTMDKDERFIFYKWFILKEIGDVILSKKFPIKNCNRKLLQFLEFIVNRRKLNKIFSKRYKDGNYEIVQYDSSQQHKSGISGQATISPLLIFRNQCESVNKLDQKFIQKPYYKLIKEMEEYVLACLKYMNIILILDDLDEIDVKLDDDSNSRDAFLQLIYAMKEINDSFVHSNIVKSKTILVIRKDILTTLNKYTSNLSKFLSDREVNLYWINKESENPEENMLMEMILTKIKSSCEELKNIENKVLYKKLFPEQISGNPIPHFLLDYSFGRPRDIITYLNIIKERYPKAAYFSPNMFLESRAAYSTKFKDELCNELHIHFDIKYIEDLFDLIKAYGKHHFNYEEIETYYSKNIRKYKHINDLKKGLEDLYKFGVLGNSRKNSKGKLIFTWGYRIDGDVNPDFNKYFTVHNALTKTLGV